MKKINYVILAFFLAVSVSACSTSTAAEKGEKDEKKTEAGFSHAQKYIISSPQKPVIPDPRPH